MKSNWITATIDDVCTVVTDGAHNSPKSVEQGHYMASVKDFTEFGFDFSNCKQIGEEDYERLRNQGCVPEKNDILVGKDGARYFEDIIIYKQNERPALLSSIAILRADCKKITPEFLYYTLKSPAVRKDVRDNYGSGSAIPRIVLKDFKRMPFSFPSIEEQRKITNLCSAIDAKIQINNAINENLEQQLRSVFMELFSDKIANVEANNHRPLGELVINIDNRGKTPPLETTPTEYPIIDVRALSGTSRIVNYADCTKFVSAETYSSWFRSGHPKPKDILVSTVGSLAEIKIFLGSKGCIAQNVVGFRTKDISPYYLYQYLTAIKNDLVAYNIGSVQPSIKVTHIIKHPIYIPSTEELETFDALAESATNAIYNNTLESERLAGIRDALIPKLMSGEIDLSEVQF